MTRAATAIVRRLERTGSAKRAVVNRWFFKTGPGEYGEGDEFVGLTVPQVRVFATMYRDLPLTDTASLLRSKWHEARLMALLILVYQYQHGDERTRDKVHALYLRSTRYINNWDLVDLSAWQIVGSHLPRRRRGLLTKLARSRSLWERRIAIIATAAYIQEGDFADTLRIARMLRDDEHDLIHKAVGWMLREVGKRDQRAEERFLRAHAARMPRTMLRYAIERFPERLRRRYLNA